MEGWQWGTALSPELLYRLGETGRDEQERSGLALTQQNLSLPSISHRPDFKQRLPLKIRLGQTVYQLCSQ